VYCGSAIAGDYIAIRAYRFLFHDWASDPPGGSMFALAFFGTTTAGWAAFGVLDISRRPPDWVPASSETG
jgi:hypothetical protein